jgi:fluoroacetyl-CoA thioesterase
MTLEPGLERTEEFTAEDRLLTDVRGTLRVGFEVCVKHVAAAPEGAACTVTAKLREVEDGRKLRFDVEVREGERTIGVGTHERRVIDRAGFG